MNISAMFFVCLIVGLLSFDCANAAIEPYNNSCGNESGYDFSSEVTISTTKQPIITTAYIKKIPVLINQDSVLFKYTIHNFAIAGLSALQNAELNKTISDTIYAAHKPDGTIIELYGNSNVPLWNFNILKSIILGFQVTRPTLDPTIKTYQVEEPDDKGIAIADYEISSDKLLIKHRRSYKTLWGEANFNLEKSNYLIHLNAAGIIQNIEMQEHISIGSPQHPLFSSNYNQTLFLKSTQPLTGSCRYTSIDEAQHQEQLIKVSFATVLDEAMWRQQKLQRLQNINFDALIKNLLPDAGEVQNAAATIMTLADLFTYYPEYLKKIPNLIETHITNGQFTGYLITSVTNANTTEASATLLEIMQIFGANRQVLIQTILAHHALTMPLLTNAQYLISLYKSNTDTELQSLILLAIGSIANRLDAEQSDATTHIVTDFIIEQLTTSNQYQIKLNALGALGNSKNIYALTTLRKVIEFEQNPQLIGKAILAIRNLPIEKIIPDLIAMLDSNNSNVALAAVLILQNNQINNDIIIQKIINAYAKYSAELKLEALTLLLESQIAKKPMVVEFIHDKQTQHAFSKEELTLIAR